MTLTRFRGCCDRVGETGEKESVLRRRKARGEGISSSTFAVTAVDISVEDN